MPTSIAPAMIKIFIIVPKPGRSLKGIHIASTIALTSRVAVPIEISSWFEIPCASTDQGALPSVDWITSESPNPNIKRPSERMTTRMGAKSHECIPVQGVFGTVL